MATTQERGQKALLEERLATARELLARGKDKDGMHWIWAAASGLDGDPKQLNSVLAVAGSTRNATTVHAVRVDCDALIDRLETQLRKTSAAGGAGAPARRSGGARAELPAASATPGVARADAYYLDERLSLAEGTCRFPANGGGREHVSEGFFVIAIRRRGYRQCLFRFADSDRVGAHLMLRKLNTRGADAAIEP